jgi:hypothetical protein
VCGDGAAALRACVLLERVRGALQQLDEVALVCRFAETHRRLAVLNVSAEEIIRSIFFNNPDACLITVSLTAGDNFASLLCRRRVMSSVLVLRRC